MNQEVQKSQSNMLQTGGISSGKTKKTSLVRIVMGSFLKLVFNKAFYVIVAIIAQMAWFSYLLFLAMWYSPYLSAAIQIIAFLMVWWIVNRRLNPSYKLAWTVVLLSIPVFGIMLYATLGSSRIAQAMQRRYAEIQVRNQDYLPEKEEYRRLLESGDISIANQSLYIWKNSGFPLQGNTTATFFQVGDEMFPVLVSELSKAEKYIFIEYFIINDGVMWQTILNILEQKAQEGVDVRLIYDGFGCFSTLPIGYYKKLNKKGIKCQVFNPFRPVLNIVQNNRDHRKLCIIDGNVGFTGGVNLSDEYINRKERFGHWKDTAVMLKGEAVWSMTVMFLHMWELIGKDETPIDYRSFAPSGRGDAHSAGEGFIQPYCDSPLDGETVGENVYLNIINRARKYVYISTPYLIIDNEMMTALCLAARSGVDVRIMTPGIPDKKIVFILTQSNYEQLLEAGVRIYEYQPGFLHAKCFVCDGVLAVVGTINLDYRSLYLHFEDGVWIYKNPVIDDIRGDFVNTIRLCDEMTLQKARQRSVFDRFIQSIFQLMAPML